MGEALSQRLGGEPRGSIAVGRVGQVGEIGAGAPTIVTVPIGAIADDEAPAAKARLDEVENVQVEPLDRVQQNEIDRRWEIGGQGLAGVANTDVNDIRETGPAQVPRGRGGLGGSNSVVMRRPPPFSRKAVARNSVETPKDVPNSTMARAPVLRARM